MNLTCGSTPRRAPTKALLRWMSKVVTPTSLRGLKQPDWRRVSATMGTVELTGLVITQTMAFGQLAAMPRAMLWMMPAFTFGQIEYVVSVY